MSHLAFGALTRNYEQATRNRSTKSVMSVTWNFSGKLVLVTGSTKGIGKAIAQAYALAGANLIIHSRNQKDVDAVVAEFKSKGSSSKDEEKSSQEIYGMIGDLGKAEDCNKIIEKINKIGHLDILINNVSLPPFIPPSTFHLLLPQIGWNIRSEEVRRYKGRRMAKDI